MKLSLDYTVARLANSSRVDLGGGLYFQGITNPKFAADSSESELRKNGVDKRIGYMSTHVYPGIGYTVGDIKVDLEWRGQYLGEKMVKDFVQLHGSLGSDPQGNTSDAARKMWERLGAEKVRTDKNTQGFIYLLRK